MDFFSVREKNNTTKKKKNLIVQGREVTKPQMRNCLQSAFLEVKMNANSTTAKNCKFISKVNNKKILNKTIE